MSWKEEWKNGKDQLAKTIKPVLKSAAKQDSKKLNIEAARTHADVFEKVDCLDCANCCTSIPPMLNRTDVSRVSKSLKMKERDFLEEYTIQDEDGDLVMKTTPCPFLMEDNACMIYEVRPKACRQYPHTDEAFAKHLKLHAQNIQYCPAVYHILKTMFQL